jgi:hypothetical protein
MRLGLISNKQYAIEGLLGTLKQAFCDQWAVIDILEY